MVEGSTDMHIIKIEFCE